MADRAPTRDEIISLINAHKKPTWTFEIANTTNLRALQHAHGPHAPMDVDDIVWTFPDSKDNRVTRTASVHFKGDDPLIGRLDGHTGGPVLRDDTSLLLHEKGVYYDMLTSDRVP